MSGRYAAVAVPAPLGQALTYGVPAELSARVVPGARVLCPLGARRVLAVVLARVDELPPGLSPDKLKPIDRVVDPEPVLPPELLAFLVELGSYYLAPIGEVVRLALPAVERRVEDDAEGRALLASAGARSVGRLVQFARRAPDVDVPGDATPRMRELLATLGVEGEVAVAELERRTGGARATLARLAERGVVLLERRAAVVDPFLAAPVVRDETPELVPAQVEALGAIRQALARAEPRAFLLHGVTGSGKTEVYIGAVASAVAAGRGALVLVPEIALTPQLVQRFRARLGDTIAVLHSGLSDRDRHAMWTALRRGDLRVAVGARSALFAPVQALGLVCVDEEHDASFKQEEGVRYHARDMALLRAHRAGAVAVLGSATPSLASEARVRDGKLTRLRLPERARPGAALPRVEIVDVRRMGPGPSGDRLLSLPLHRAIERTLAAGDQVILFLNRRGFSPSVVCDGCGAVVECPACSVALTVHRKPHEHVACHYCDYRDEVPLACPSCGAVELVHEGAGTERIEALLSESFPGARVARLDRDVAAGARSEAVLDRVRRREIDVLVGTQMVTKGHDLPGVTLVGVLNADAALSLPDFQAAERTFQLLVQVAGRAGRGDRPGEVLVQTRNPEHPAVRLAVTHDVEGFVERELADRRELGYPPFARIALVRVDAVDARVAARVAGELAAIARRVAVAGLEVVGPAPAPLERLRGRHRFRFLVRASARPSLRRALLAVQRAEYDRRARVLVDVDPVHML